MSRVEVSNVRRETYHRREPSTRTMPTVRRHLQETESLIALRSALFSTLLDHPAAISCRRFFRQDLSRLSCVGVLWIIGTCQAGAATGYPPMPPSAQCYRARSFARRLVDQGFTYMDLILVRGLTIEVC